MKLYDFDALFEKSLSRYMKQHEKEYTEDEWEDIVPKLYEKFGDTVVSQLGKTPKQYYGDMDGETLVATLRAHLSHGVPVSGYLSDAAENMPGARELIMPLLSGCDEEIAYAVNFLGADPEALPEYIEIIYETDSDDLRDECLDLVKEKADDVKNRALAHYERGEEKEIMLEILSRCTERDDKVFSALLNALRTDPENIPMHAGFIAAYGDERALPYLTELISQEGISFVEYRELKCAIETLGGSYDDERDFSEDKDYGAVKEQSSLEGDIFSSINDGTQE